jgi:hypothetical protein
LWLEGIRDKPESQSDACRKLANAFEPSLPQVSRPREQLSRDPHARLLDDNGGLRPGSRGAVDRGQGRDFEKVITGGRRDVGAEVLLHPIYAVLNFEILCERYRRAVWLLDLKSRPGFLGSHGSRALFSC